MKPAAAALLEETLHSILSEHERNQDRVSATDTHTRQVGLHSKFNISWQLLSGLQGSTDQSLSGTSQTEASQLMLMLPLATFVKPVFASPFKAAAKDLTGGSGTKGT